MGTLVRSLIDGVFFLALVAGGVVFFVQASEAGFYTVLAALGALALMFLLGMLYMRTIRRKFDG